MKLPWTCRPVFGAILAIACFTTSPASGHEMWLEPDSHQVAADGEPILGQTKVGEEFKGYTSMYLPRDFERFEVADSAGSYPVTGTVGDRPPLNIVPRQEGLAIVTYFSEPRTVRFKEWEKFAKYLTSMGIEPPLARHKERGLDPTDFVESYRRASKSLIAVGAGAGEDRDTGMPYELIALENPYTRPAGLDAALPVQLVRKGTPVPNVRVTLFHKNRETVTTQFLETDAQGVVSVPSLGPGRYLLNSVDLMEREGEDVPPWHSVWASLTYGSGNPDGMDPR